MTGRLCFHVSVSDNRLRGARAVPVCPGNVFVFIFCLREAFLSFSLCYKKDVRARDVLHVCVCVTHAMKSLPGEA